MSIFPDEEHLKERADILAAVLSIAERALTVIIQLGRTTRMGFTEGEQVKTILSDLKKVRKDWKARIASTVK